MLRKSLCKFIKILLSIPSNFWKGYKLTNIKSISLYFRLHLTLKASVLFSTVVKFLRGGRWVLQPAKMTFSDIKSGQVLALTHPHPSSFLVAIMNAKCLFSEELMLFLKCLHSIMFTKKQSTQAQTTCICYLYCFSARYFHFYF